MGKTEGDVIDNLGFLEGEQSLVIAARREQAVWWLGRMGRMGDIFPLSRIIRIIPIFSHSRAEVMPALSQLAAQLGGDEARPR